MSKEKADLQHVHQLQKQLSEARWDYWVTEVLLSWQWIFLLVCSIVFTLVWLHLVKKNTLLLTLVNGLLTLAFCLIADTLGGELQLWDYPRMLLPWGARIICIDWMIAAHSMLLYQYFSGWRAFLAAAAGLSVLFAGVLEPLAVWMGIYIKYSWSSWYSLPAYFLLFCGMKAAADGIGRRQAGHLERVPKA
ncbi:CBO0543 family protein [Paenibacillus pinistramenti]|uniref:CBO0543 family protein n=1 Tax=Paenibacillus pinistramenti TaxID=1768003 RepID=UPI00110989F2|nr:CBO0543 family protein [Paenibacillus pinistramenti]